MDVGGLFLSELHKALVESKLSESVSFDLHAGVHLGRLHLTRSFVKQFSAQHELLVHTPSERGEENERWVAKNGCGKHVTNREMVQLLRDDASLVILSVDARRLPYVSDDFKQSNRTQGHVVVLYDFKPKEETISVYDPLMTPPITAITLAQLRHVRKCPHSPWETIIARSREAAVNASVRRDYTRHLAALNHLS